MMRKRFNEYEEGIVPLEETIGIDIGQYYDKNNPFHLLVIGKTGRQKTRMIKNLIKIMHKIGYKILYIEPKAFEMNSANEEGSGYRIAQYDKNESLPVVTYVPSCLKEHILRIDDYRKLYAQKKIKLYRVDISTLDYREIWLSFGMPEKVAAFIANLIREKTYDLKVIRKKLSQARFLTNTIIAGMGVLDNMIDEGTFDEKYPTLQLAQEWEENNIVNVCYAGRQGKFMNTDIGLLVTMVKTIGQNEGDKVTKKLIVFDDAFMYAGASAYSFAQSDISFAQNEMAQCQYNYRKFGIDTITIIQNLDRASIIPTLIEGKEDFLVTKTGSSEILARLIPFSAYYLVTNQNEMKGRQLYTNKNSYYFEWVYVNADGEWASGYPFDCTVGHPSK